MTRAIAVAMSCLALAACGTAQTSLTDDDTTTVGPAKCPGGLAIGAGTGEQRNAIEDVGVTYAGRCTGATVNYHTRSSADAVADYVAEQADWVGLDAPITDAGRRAMALRCTDGEILSFPAVAGPIAIAVNIAGVDELTLSAPALGRIFDGAITRWNDPAITALNPGVPLPDAVIRVAAREDASGVTGAVQRYLADSGDWPADRVGDDWHGKGERSAGTPGVLAHLRATDGSIGYVEFSAARDNDLTVARLDSGAGAVELTTESAAAGLATAEVGGTGGDVRLTPKPTQAGAGAYPLQVVSYQVICSTGAKSGLLKDLFGCLASDPQQAALGELGYSPLPEPTRTQVRDALKRIK